MKAGLDATQDELDFIAEMERLLESGRIESAVDAYFAESDGEDVAPYEYLTGRRN